MLGSLCFSLDLNRGSTGGFSMNMWRTTCVWPCSGTSISVLKLSSINQALSLQFSLQDWIFVEARSFLETSCGSRKKKVTVGCSLAYRVDLLSYIHLTHVYIRCIYIIYKHINSKQGGALLWNYMVLTSCHTHSPARSLTQSSPAGMAIRMWRPLAFHHGHVFQVCRNMWILLQWGLMWQVQTDFCKAFARAVFLKESACIAGYVYIYSCFQKTNSSHIYIYIHTPQHQSMYQCFSVEITTMHVEIDMADRPGTFHWDPEVCKGVLPGWHRGRAVGLLVPSLESTLESKPEKIRVLVIYTNIYILSQGYFHLSYISLCTFILCYLCSPPLKQ